ncbi:MAG TPA: class I SAM-dependent rRNA methyltransferase [Polyangiaceae bacterium]|nr:class I SAM-dependent rRNA methyltransferase [Polyangiaceae bacterium]
MTALNVGSVTLQKGHVQPVWAGHPWVFAQAVERIEGGVTAGDEVVVRDARGNALGRGLYSPGSAIPVRIYSRDPDRALDARFFEERIEEAIKRRRLLDFPSAETTGFRLLHAEGDALPGLVVDCFNDVLAVQFGTYGVKRREAWILEALQRLLSPRAIVDRTTARAAKTEGFQAGEGVIRGQAELSAFEFQERRFQFSIPLSLGQKTGFYFDQRPLRARVEKLAKGCRVLDAHSYTGAVALSAARGGAASVEAVDTSALALEVAAETAERNHLLGRVKFECADAQSVLNHAGNKGGYDLVILDPPKLAPSRGKRERALDAMRRLCASGARATRPGGILIVSSCSAALGLPELTRAVALGARDVGLGALVLDRLFQGADHPVPAAFPEGLYLSTVITQVSRL